MHTQALVTSLLLLIACATEAAPPEAAETVTVAPVASETTPAVPEEARVTKIVFVGQKNSCQCTQDRIAESWSEIEAAIAGRGIEVEQLQHDVEKTRAEELRGLEAFVVAPAVYFFDEHGVLVEMLQGEIVADDVTDVIAR